MIHMENVKAKTERVGVLIQANSMSFSYYPQFGNETSALMIEFG